MKQIVCAKMLLLITASKYSTANDIMVINEDLSNPDIPSLYKNQKIRLAILFAESISEIST